MLLKIEKALPSWLEALALDASSRTGSRRISTSTVKKDRKLLEETVISRQKQEETRRKETLLAVLVDYQRVVMSIARLPRGQRRTSIADGWPVD